MAETLPTPLESNDPERLLADRAWLVRIATALLGDPGEAEDLAQEVHLRALTSPPREGEERPWLRRVARNIASRWRSRRRWRAGWERGAAKQEREPSSTELVARVEAQRAVADAVLKLGGSDREVVLLRYFDDLAPAAIATRLGLPVETVRTRLKRALARLRERLDAAHGGREAWSALLAPWMGVATMHGATKVAIATACVVAVSLGVGSAFIERGHDVAPRPIGTPAASSPALAPPVAASTHEIEHPDVVAPTATRADESISRGGRIHVVDATGHSIEGASVYAGACDDSELVATTDADGAARLPESIGNGWLIVTAPGMQPSERPLRAARPAELTVNLQPGATIAGMVRTYDPDEARPGMRVFALDADRPCSPKHLAAICAGRAPGPITTTDHRGAFVLEGLDPATVYSIVVGGDGFVNLRSDPGSAPVKPGTKDLVVTIGALYAVDLQISQLGGRPLPAADWFGPPLLLEDHQADMVEDPWRPIVAGIAPDHRRWERSHLLLLHVRESFTDDRIGPYYHCTNEAGFVPRTVSFFLQRITASIPTERIEIEPLPEVGFGRVTVEIVGEDQALSSGAGDGLLGVFSFSPIDSMRFGAGGPWEAGVRVGGGHRQTITGVPLTKYSFGFRALDDSELLWPRRDGDEAWPSLDVRDADTRLVLDLRDCGDVEFDVTRADGSAESGAFTLTIHSVAVRDSGPDPLAPAWVSYLHLRHVSLDGAPYFVRALPAGRYVAQPELVKSWSPQSRLSTLQGRHGRMPPVEFKITAGAITHCAIASDR